MAGRIVLMGTSMGGSASLATGAANPAGVSAVISFAGGTEGNGAASPEHSCAGSGCDGNADVALWCDDHVPTLWLYAENDSFWGAERPRAWYRAFARGRQPEPLGSPKASATPTATSCSAAAAGCRLWIAHVDRFLSDIGFPSPTRRSHRLPGTIAFARPAGGIAVAAAPRIGTATDGRGQARPDPFETCWSHSRDPFLLTCTAADARPAAVGSAPGAAAGGRAAPRRRRFRCRRDRRRPHRRVPAGRPTIVQIAALAATFGAAATS